MGQRRRARPRGRLPPGRLPAPGRLGQPGPAGPDRPQPRPPRPRPRGPGHRRLLRRLPLRRGVVRPGRGPQVQERRQGQPRPGRPALRPDHPRRPPGAVPGRLGGRRPGQPQDRFSQTLWGCLQTDERGRPSSTPTPTPPWPPAAPPWSWSSGPGPCCSPATSTWAAWSATASTASTTARSSSSPRPPAAPGAGSSRPGAPNPGGTPHTGDFTDAYGNRMRVLAVANPRLTKAAFRAACKGRNAELGDRRRKREGYGLVRVDKAKRRFVIECWPWTGERSSRLALRAAVPRGVTELGGDVGGQVADAGHLLGGEALAPHLEVGPAVEARAAVLDTRGPTATSASPPTEAPLAEVEAAYIVFVSLWRRPRPTRPRSRPGRPARPRARTAGRAAHRGSERPAPGRPTGPRAGPPRGRRSPGGRRPPSRRSPATAGWPGRPRRPGRCRRRPGPPPARARTGPGGRGPAPAGPAARPAAASSRAGASSTPWPRVADRDHHPAADPRASHGAANTA